MDSDEKYAILQHALGDLEKAKEAILTAINHANIAGSKLLAANVSEEGICKVDQKLVAAKWAVLVFIHDLKRDYQLEA